MKPSDFKFTTTFVSPAKVSLGNISKANASSSLLATASLDDLKQLLPDEAEIADNPDLLYTCFNAAVINLINANDHGMGTDTALAIASQFKDKYMNVEHDRYHVIGHIMNYGFSTFGENKMVNASALEGSTEPFNLCLGAIVYRVVDEWLASMIENSADPSHYMYQEISTSWEVGYNEYDIVLGSKKLADAEIVTEESKQVEFDEYLRMNGGTGFTPDGTPVYALIKGDDARALGCAFTFAPAAAVKGVTTASKEDDKETFEVNTKGNVGLACNEPTQKLEASEENAVKEEKKEDLEVTATASVKTASSEENKEKTTQKDKKTVITIMKPKAIEDITSAWLQEAQASDVTTFIRERLQETTEEFSTKLKKAEDEKEDIASQLQTIKDEKGEADKKVEDLSAEVDGLKETIAAKEKEDAFNSRMAEITEAYELSDDQREAVATQIRDLDDEGFKAWKAQFVLFASEKKEEKKEDPAKAASEALDSVQADEELIPNGQDGDSDPMDSVMKSFQDNLKIQAR